MKYKQLVTKRIPLRRCSITLLTVAIGCCLAGELRSEPPAADSFSELAAAYRSIGRFLVGNAVRFGKDNSTDNMRPRVIARASGSPFPAQARMLAYEEHNDFIYAVADVSRPTASQQRNADPKPAFTRRFVFLKPSIVVVDDTVRHPGARGSLQWILRGRTEATAAGSRLAFSGDGQELVCETVWPIGERLQKVAKAQDSSQHDYEIAIPSRSATETFRWLHVFQTQPSHSRDKLLNNALEKEDGLIELTVTTPNRRFQLNLPPADVDAGQITIGDAAGESLVATRPFAAGILPHGPEGSRLIERWDSRYRDGRKPPWDTGLVAQDLKETVERGVVRPCRTIVLGCGSGTNAIYLASQGFDVTAVDIAPTALSIAAEKARKANVQVHWVLADVLALPEMEPFDFIFDRGCYHNVRYVDAGRFIESVRRLSGPGTRFLILSLNRDGPPGVREHHMRDDFSKLFEFEWLRESNIQTEAQGGPRRNSWSAMLLRKKDHDFGLKKPSSP